MKEPSWVDERDASALHAKVQGLHGGAGELRNAGLLASSLARPRRQFAYSDNSDLITLAAAYTSGIVKNHPFVDGNTRVGFVVGILFLEINGYRFKASEDEAAQAVIDLAAGRLDEKGYAQFLRTNAVRKRQRSLPG